MATSKKLYVAVASIIAAEFNKQIRLNYPTAANAVRNVAVLLAEEFTADNPRFDRARFMTACGLT